MTVVVVGVGNDFRGDDAAGLEVARRLRCAAPAGAVVLDCEAEHTGLLHSWEGERDVIVVDATRSGATPGTIHRLDAAAGPLPAQLFAHSTHHLNVADTVELGRALDRLPERLEVLGIEGSRFDLGAELSPEVERAVEGLAAELLERLGEIERLG